MVGWPDTREDLEELQRRLALEEPEPWTPPADGRFTLGAVFATFSTGADPAPVERAWVAAVAGPARSMLTVDVLVPYEPGYLALREGLALERAVRGLTTLPDVLLVDATGRDHPRGAGLALHLGWVLALPTIGVTDRPLVAEPDDRGRLVLADREVGRWVVTRRGTRPVFAHAAWRTGPEVAEVVVRAAAREARTPEPLRRARYLARWARARDEDRLPGPLSLERAGG